MLAPIVAGAALCLAIVALGYLGPLLVNPAGALSPFRYAAERPFEVESFPATLVWLGGFAGLPVHRAYGFGASNYFSPANGIISQVANLILIAGILWLCWRLLTGKLSFTRAILACLCIVLVTSKVFSPSYLIWVLPIVAVEEGFNPIWVAIAALTTLEYPLIQPLHRYVSPNLYINLFQTVVAIRNVLLVYTAARHLTGKRLTPASLDASAEKQQERERASTLSPA
jgi:hypothetical protein